MAVYEINIFVTVSPEHEADVIDVMDNKLVTLDANKLWLDDYRKTRSIDVEGNKTLNASIRFKNEADRTIIRTWMINKVKESGILPKLLVGSYIESHNCYHDEGKSCPTPTRYWEKL